MHEVGQKVGRGERGIKVLNFGHYLYTMWKVKWLYFVFSGYKYMCCIRFVNPSDLQIGRPICKKDYNERLKSRIDLQTSRVHLKTSKMHLKTSRMHFKSIQKRREYILNAFKNVENAFYMHLRTSRIDLNTLKFCFLWISKQNSTFFKSILIVF